MRQYIGQLIEEEVRKQNLIIEKFADDIHTTRANVYDIFKRKDINLGLLMMISKVLGRNFIKEIDLNPDILDPDDPEIIRQLEEDKAVIQLLDVFPKAMRNLGIEDVIVLTGSAFAEEDIQTFLPDFGLSEHAIFFYKHPKEDLNKFLTYELITDGKGNSFRLSSNNEAGTYYAEVLIEYKTLREWEDYLRFIFQECRRRGVNLMTSGITKR